RCTTLRRLIVHRSVADAFITRLAAVYGGLPIGNPLDEGTLVGPLIDHGAWVAMDRALDMERSQGGRIICGGERITEGVPPGGVYVSPAIVEISPTAAVVQEETFAPILYVHRYDGFDEAVGIHNSVPQGLSSAIFTS